MSQCRIRWDPHSRAYSEPSTSGPSLPSGLTSQPARCSYDESLAKIDVAEIGPRLVLEPVRIIASGFGGAVLYSMA